MTRDPISKALQALTWMLNASQSDVGVREMASALDVSPSTAHRMLSALVSEGLVMQDLQTGRYALGLSVFRLGLLAVSRLPLRAIAMRHMRSLVAACNETAVLGLYDGARLEMFFAASVESTNALRYVLELNQWLPVYAGASGMAIMAFLPVNERHRIVARTRLAPVTDSTITDASRLESELQKIRKRGYAITHGQRIKGAVGIAAPISGPTGVVGDVCLTLPEQRFDKNSEERLSQLLRTCTREIMQEIGGQ